jgi:hypothetical protein
MTAQIAEKLIYGGKKVAMCTEPLAHFCKLGGEVPEFAFNCTALWRGYVGTWELVGARLYLIGLTGTIQDGTEATLETVFPGFPDRVFAHWYSGTLRIPEGQMLEYVHMGYGSTFARDRFLRFEQGVLVANQLRENGVAKGDSEEEGYGIGGMTMFPVRGGDQGDKP